jgi:CubicO group peptidase (beta-lactamase class C family)
MFRLRSAQLGTVAQKPLEALAAFGDRSSPAGAKFAYASAETTVLGYVLLRATDTDLAELTSRWLWQPLGAEAEAAWNVGVDGQEMAEGNFNARLRDYGRLGILLANEGRIGERQIVPAEYLLDATDAARQPEAFRPGAAMPYFGYGYQFWLYPFRTRTFAMLGIYGQSVMVQPRSQIVMVQTAVYDQPLAVEPNLERDAVWRGVLACLGGQVDDL